jgi:prepilin-type processing-associated H-X9-DG protein
MHNYHTSCNGFPPATYLGTDAFDRRKGLHVILLPYFEQAGIDDMFIDGIHDLDALPESIISKPIAVFVCPSNPVVYDEHHMAAYGEKLAATHYNGSMGPGFNGRYVKRGSHSGNYNTDGVFIVEDSVRVADITDGTANTLAVGERNYQIRAWVKGGQYDVTRGYACVTPAKNISCPLNASVEEYCYVGSGCAAGAVNIFFNDLYFGSFHPGGADFTFADGSVHFLSDDIGFGIYQALGSVDGGEVVQTADFVN